MLWRGREGEGGRGRGWGSETDRHHSGVVPRGPGAVQERAGGRVDEGGVEEGGGSLAQERVAVLQQRVDVLQVLGKLPHLPQLPQLSQLGRGGERRGWDRLQSGRGRERR